LYVCPNVGGPDLVAETMIEAGIRMGGFTGKSFAGPLLIDRLVVNVPYFF
jgi:hypothetical protein